MRMSAAGRSLRAGAAVVALLVAAGCGDATGTDGTPASVTANVTVPASAVIGSPVNPAPAVLVKNAGGEPLPNVRVTFSVTAGGGSVTGASQLTDGSGVATVDAWTLGDTPGVQTLTATAGGQSVTFTLQATNDCTITGAIAAGQTVTGDLRTSPCPFGDGTVAQSWSFEQPTGQSAISFAMHATGSPTFDTYLVLHRNAFTAFEKALAANDDDAGSSADSRINTLLGPGSYVVTANNYDPGITGAFTLGAEVWSGEMANCQAVFVTPGITSSQTMDNSSCFDTSTGQEFDFVGLYLNQGEQVQIDMTSAAFDPELQLYSVATGALLVQNDNGGGGTSARLTYTAPGSDLYVIQLTSPNASQTGAYNFSVTQLTPAPSALASSPARPLAGGPSWATKRSLADFANRTGSWRRAQ